jgi:uncharacterized ion transporter superfamily protein YfcC
VHTSCEQGMVSNTFVIAAENNVLVLSSKLFNILFLFKNSLRVLVVTDHNEAANTMF